MNWRLISYSVSNNADGAVAALRSRYSSMKFGGGPSGIGQPGGMVGWPFNSDVLVASPRREKFDISRASPGASTWAIAISDTKVQAPKRAIFPLVSQIGITYRHSSLSEDKTNFGVKAGDRMPYFVVDGASVYDRLREPTFHLIVFADGTGNGLQLSEEFKNANGNIVDFHSLPSYPDIVKIFVTDSSFFVLLRPDNYIGLISNGNSIEEVEAYLDHILHV